MRERPKVELDRLAGSANHQGLVLEVAPFEYQHVGEILAAAKQLSDTPCSSPSTASPTRTMSARSRVPPQPSEPGDSSSPPVGRRHHRYRVADVRRCPGSATGGAGDQSDPGNR